ncbi:MAG TPA: SAM-dependent methyltransferase, partial [Alphaproteobacteria bacterium]|nr:SAM-dependent methyltransferase [Alphaproteobacteria bacterium]
GYWAAAGVAGKIRDHVGPALATLDEFIHSEAEPYDFAFIDADKGNYDNYFERALTLVRKGGVIAIDNVLWSGSVVDPTVQDDDTRAIRALNEKLRQDPRIEIAMATIADGLFLCLKR